MPTLFSSIHNTLSAMLAHQQAIQVTEHNVANANTPGYHRQEAVLTNGLPYPYPTLQGSTFPGQMGAGVRIDQVRRFNLEFFDARCRSALADAGRWETQSLALKQVELTLAETGSDGLSARLDAFWAGWQALAGDPTSMALRADLRQRAADLTNAFNFRASALISLQKDQDLSILQRVDEINGAAARVARLNAQVAAIQAAGDAPNDLLDERDLLLDRLASLAGATTSIQENGQALVAVGGHALVAGSQTFSLTATPGADPNKLLQVAWDDGMAFSTPRGELQGLLEARDTLIPAQIKALDDLAVQLVNAVNPLHRAGAGLAAGGSPPPTGNDFFQSFTSTRYALEISLSSQVDDLNNIAVAAASGAPGDGSQGFAIAGLRDARLMNSGTATLNQYLAGVVAGFGLEVSGAAARARERSSLAEALGNLRESQTGVSLDEEAANLVKYQRSYQAAARMMTALDEMLDRVINGMGVVGR